MASKTPKYDAKLKALLDAAEVGEQTCSVTGRTWERTEEELDWCKRMNVPPLTVSPETFTRQYMALHTGYSWWWNTDVETGKKILTYMHPSRPFKVMNDDAWNQKDFSEMGRDLSLEQPFFDQLFELAKDVPMSAWKNDEKPVNSIARISLGDENSYFVAGTRGKNSLYSADSYDLDNSVEVTWSSNVTDSYNLVRGNNISRSRVVRESRNCIECSFIFDCRDCEFCFMSWNQRHGKYLWRNEQLSKEEWEKRWSELNLGSAKVFYKLYEEFKQALGADAVWPENFNIKSVNSTGEYLTNCLDCKNSWYCDGEQRAWWSIWGNEGSEDNALGIDYRSSRGFGNPVVIDSSDCRFAWFVSRSQRVEYSIECRDCEDCFGCIGLRRKQFCIFNKQYIEEEYWEKVDALKCAMLERGEYGQSYPQDFSQTPYQHSAHSIVFQEDQGENKIGFLTYDPDSNGAFGDWEGKEMYKISDIPDDIKDVGDEWLGRAIWDDELKRPFGILKPELAFYRKMNLPVRREHFISRVERGLWREVTQMSMRELDCKQCGKVVEVAYNQAYPDRKIYCSPCYLEYLENR